MYWVTDWSVVKVKSFTIKPLLGLYIQCCAVQGQDIVNSVLYLILYTGYSNQLPQSFPTEGLPYCCSIPRGSGTKCRTLCRPCAILDVLNRPTQLLCSNVLPVFWTICKTPTTFAVQTISDYRRGPGVLESPPIIGHADNQKNDFGYNLGGLEVFNKGDEFFELQLKPTIYITIPYHYIY